MTMHAELDDDSGQPRVTAFQAARRTERAIHDMLGLVKSVIVDGKVTDEEARFLARWISANPAAVNSWPGSALARRLTLIFEDGRVDAEERKDLLFFLQDLAGRHHRDDGPITVEVRLPLDSPAPQLVFAGTECVFVGHFVWGTRPACEELVTARGGTCAHAVTPATGIVVIGQLGCDDWRNSQWGSSIQLAVDLRARGGAPAIVDEEHWVRCL